MDLQGIDLPDPVEFVFNSTISEQKRRTPLAATGRANKPADLTQI
jgi:hypothetical protein